MKQFSMSMYANKEQLLEDKALYYQKEYVQMLKTFRHIHVNNGVDDACKKCGLDLRHEVHHTEFKQPFSTLPPTTGERA